LYLSKCTVEQQLKTFMTTWGAWLLMLLLLLWLTFGAVVRSGSSVMASWTDVHCVTGIEGCLSWIWCEVDHCFVDWFADSGIDHVLGVALQFSSVLPVSKGYRPCGCVCSLSSYYCQKYTLCNEHITVDVRTHRL
jgi:hypothetical protein